MWLPQNRIDTQVSADCARRDLRVLEGKGLLQRTHGGAIAIHPKEIYPAPTYNPVDVKEIQIDCLAVAKRAVTIAEILRKKMNISVILLGGEMSHRGHCHDFYTIQMVKNIRIDKAFLSHTALSLDFGASIHDAAGVEFGKAVMKNSAMNIGLYPSRKIGKNSIHSVCQLRDYDVLITDSNISEDFLMQVKELGVVIETVDIEGE